MDKIKTQLSADLIVAMKERNAIATKTIRTLMSEIDNAGAVVVEEPKIMPMSGGIAGATSGVGSTDVSRKILSETEVKQIIQREIDDLTNVMELVKQHSELDTEQYVQQINILKGYLNTV